MGRSVERLRGFRWLPLLALAVGLAIVSGFGATAARADDPTAVELVGTWFGEQTTPLGVVPVELQIGPTKNRRFAWVALENFGNGPVEVATGLGTISESGEGQIKGDGVPGNPAGLLRISAHGQVRGHPGLFTADFTFHGLNLDGSMVDGTITLQQRNETG